MIYFDNAATTPLLPEVIDKMSETMKTTFGNPSSLHAHGRMASKLLRESREQIAQPFAISAGEINSPIFSAAVFSNSGLAES